MKNEPFLEPILRRMRVRRVLPHIVNKAGSRSAENLTLLDIGCGISATFLKTVSSHITSGVGVDFKVEDIQTRNIKTIRMRLEDSLPFPNSTFNVVTMLAVLEHIENERQILAEAYRVLVPGGKLIITVPSLWSQPVLEFLSYKLKIVSEAEIRDHKRYYNREKLKKVLVEKTGFEQFYHRYFQLWMNNFCTAVKPS